MIFRRTLLRESSCSDCSRYTVRINYLSCAVTKIRYLLSAFMLKIMHFKIETRSLQLSNCREQTHFVAIFL